MRAAGATMPPQRAWPTGGVISALKVAMRNSAADPGAALPEQPASSSSVAVRTRQRVRRCRARGSALLLGFLPGALELVEDARRFGLFLDVGRVEAPRVP